MFGSLEVVKLPKRRSDKLSRHANWPITMKSMAGLGVASVAEPDRSGIDDRKLPSVMGAPSRSNGVGKQPAVVEIFL